MTKSKEQTVKDLLGENGLCPQPWSQFEIQDNKFLACCQTLPRSWITKQKDFLSPNDQTISLDDIVNNPQMNELRKTMMEGQWPESCKRCQMTEKGGLVSQRLRKPIPINFNDRITRTDADGRYDFEKKDFGTFEIHLGNECNQKCLYCSPRASNLLLEEHKEYFGDSSEYFVEDTNWYVDSKIWDKLIEHGITEMIFEGGEPLFNKNHRFILEKLIDGKISHEIRLIYTTNLMPLSKKMIDLWDNFEYVQLTVSLDGTHDHQNYIRYLSDYNRVMENINSLIGSRKIRFKFNSVLTVYNSFNTVDLYHELLSFDCPTVEESSFIRSSPVSGHKFYSIRVLPPELKEEVKNYWSEQQANSPLTGKRKETLDRLIQGNLTYMMGEDWSHLWPEFIRFTKFFDAKRSLDFTKVDPRFIPYM